MTKRLRILRALAALAAALGTSSTCQRGDDPGEVLHPTPENAPPRDAQLIVRDGVPTTLSPEALVSWLSVRDALAGARTVLRIGAGSGKGPDAFGRIWDALVSADGSVFVLDEQAQEVRVFDPAGRFVEAIGGIGDGPTDFRYANGIEMLSDGRLLVSTRSRSMKVFGDTADGWQLDQVVALPVVAEDMCATSDDRVFVSGWGRDRNTVMYEVRISPDDKGRHFGDGYQDDLWLLQSQMADGVVGCLAGPERVVFAYELLPIVRSFDPDDGSISWTARIEDFVSSQVVEGFDGQTYVTRRRSVEEEVVGGVHGLTPNHVFLQSARINTRAGTVAVHSFLLDAVTGGGAFLGDDLPVIYDLSMDRYIAMFEDPYPRIEVRAIAPG